MSEKWITTIRFHLYRENFFDKTLRTIVTLVGNDET